MPVERYKIGRAYTRRERVDITNPMTPEDASALKALLPSGPIHQPGPAYLWRIKPSLEWARSVLEQKNMPLDPNAPIYSDNEWRRKNARKSAEWYAINMILEASDLCIFVDRGDAAMAANLALSFGELTTEAKFIFEYVRGNTARGGAEAKASDKRKETAQEHARWRREAVEWWRRHPLWSQTTVAGRIDPARQRTVRGVIAGLDPRRARK